MKALDTLTSFFNMILLSIPIPNQQNQAILLNSTCGNEHFNINGLWDEMQIYLIWSQHVPTESYMSIEYKILVLSTDLHLYRVQRNKKKKKPNNCVMLLHTIIPILETSIQFCIWPIQNFMKVEPTLYMFMKWKSVRTAG